MTGRVRVTVAVLGLMCAAAPLAAQAATPIRAPRRSWTADRQDFVVGDVITVLIDELTVASANKGTSASDRRGRDLGLGASQSVVASLPSIGADVTSTSSAESSQRGESTQANHFQGEMTVRVTEIENGLLRVEGIKLVDVDGSKQELTLKGWIRPQDVSARNLIDSWRLGDAELTYTSNGSLDKPAGGIIGKLLGALWP